MEEGRVTFISPLPNPAISPPLIGAKRRWFSVLSHKCFIRSTGMFFSHGCSFQLDCMGVINEPLRMASAMVGSHFVLLSTACIGSHGHQERNWEEFKIATLAHTIAP
jgi:hypothetical protein